MFAVTDQSRGSDPLQCLIKLDFFFAQLYKLCIFHSLWGENHRNHGNIPQLAEKESITKPTWSCDAIHNFKWVKIIQISQNGGQLYSNITDWFHILSFKRFKGDT